MAALSLKSLTAVALLAAAMAAPAATEPSKTSTPTVADALADGIAKQFPDKF